jgi:hypothetical protein
MLAASKQLKRPYLGDLKPFSHLYSPTNIATQTINAVVITSVKVMDQYNAELKNFHNDNPDLDDDDFVFDWKVCTLNILCSNTSL